jgi:catechol 2,3-dioxygenase-like lactoylglutathione lyase family enzyme
MSGFQPPIPILRSFDEKATKSFYVEFLGFKIEFEHRFEPNLPLYFGIRRDDCVLHLSEHFGDSTPGSALRIDVADVNAYCRTLNEKQSKHARPGVQSQPWGYDDMAISDPSGNRLIFCTPRQ